MKLELTKEFAERNRLPEKSRVRQEGRYWLVEILSYATGHWIVQGEWLTKSAAEQDRKNWM